MDSKVTLGFVGLFDRLSHSLDGTGEALEA